MKSHISQDTGVSHVLQLRVLHGTLRVEKHNVRCHIRGSHTLWSPVLLYCTGSSSGAAGPNPALTEFRPKREPTSNLKEKREKTPKSHTPGWNQWHKSVVGEQIESQGASQISPANCYRGGQMCRSLDPPVENSIEARKTHLAKVTVDSAA